MSFLDEFDRRAKEHGLPPEKQTLPAEDVTEDDRQLLEFADLVRMRVSATPEERARVLARIRKGQPGQTQTAAPLPAPTSSSGMRWTRMMLGAAAVLLLIVVRSLSFNTRTPNIHPDHGSDVVAGSPGPKPITGSIVAAPHFDAKAIQDEFSGEKFPEPVVQDEAASAETANDRTDARLLRASGLVMLQLKGEKRWRVCARGQASPPGATLRIARRANSSASLLAPDGSVVTLAPGAVMQYDGPRAWTLSEGNAFFDVAERKDLEPFTVTTPHGKPRALGTQFGLEVSPQLTSCWVERGKVALNADATKVCDAGHAAVLDKAGVRHADKMPATDWLQLLRTQAESDHGVGQLIANADKSTEHVALEIKSHEVNVTVMEQVARTFVDMVFVNNSDRRLEGTFYYPLPPDASISEFAMYVGDKRIVGEVLEQQHARQIFEYIVRQQKDPALLEYAGGNIFKMRVFPIEPRSEKRVQLGYTQILKRSGGKVTYSYPLFSEMLVKNPLHDLKIDFHVGSSSGLENLNSPTHRCASAVNPEKTLGALSFHAANYSPTRDFCVTYDAPNAPKCAAFANQRPEDENSYFMLQLCPAARTVKSDLEPRLLVIVDGSASNDPQEYAIASEFAAMAADVSRNLQFGLVRGGQSPEVFGGGMIQTDATTPEKVREFLQSRPPLGATDLNSTFQAAAKLAGGESLRVVYIGSAIDTVSELAQSQQIAGISAMFTGKSIALSMVAVGSRYERPIMQGLAAELDGAFTRIEGADGVADAVGRIYDGFYRASLGGIRVEFEGVAVNHVYPEILGTITAGDTAVVLGRVTHPGKGRVTVHADADGQKFTRTFDIDLSANETQNRFLPRLWARAHMEALQAGLGLGEPRDDAAIRAAVIDTSCTYQIMSPFTAFLVLESEEDYARFGIKRTMKQWDWSGAENEITDGRDEEKAKTEASSRPMSKSKELLDEGLDSDVLFGDKGDIKSLGDFQMRDKSDSYVDSAGFDSEDDRAGLGGKREYASKDGEALDNVEYSDHFESVDDLAQAAGEPLSRNRAFSGFYSSGYVSNGRFDTGRGFHSSSLSQTTFASLVLNSGTLVELEIDQPLHPLSYYQRLLNAGKADVSTQLNLSLAYEANGQFDAALAAFKPVLQHYPKVADLLLQQASLNYRAMASYNARSIDAAKTPQYEAAARMAIASALELTSEADRPVMKFRIAQLLSALKHPTEAAALYRELLDNRGKDQTLQNIISALAYTLFGAEDLNGCREALESALKRWPADAAVRETVASCFSNTLRDYERATAILRETEKLDDSGRQQFIALLVQIGKIDDALLQLNALASSAKDSNTLCSALAAFYNSDRAPGSDLALGFLKAGSQPIQAAAALQYLQSYGYGTVWKEEDAATIFAAASRADLPAQAKLNACYLLWNSNQLAQMHSVDNAKLAALLDPLLTTTATKEEVALAIQAIQALAPHVHDESILNHARRLLQLKELDPWQRAQLKQIEFTTLQEMGRNDEAAAALNKLFEDGDEPSVHSVAWNLMSVSLSQNDDEAAVKILERFVQRFPKSHSIAQFHDYLMQTLRYRQDSASLDSTKKRLLDVYPNTPACLSLRVQLLTAAGRLKEAQAAVRAAMEALQKEHDHPTPEPQDAKKAPEPKTEDEKKALERKKHSDARQREREYEQRRLAMIHMLARLCGRDADSRAAFIAEAEARMTTEDPGQCEWTDAILTCLRAAGDLPGAIKRLETLVRTEAADPLWARQLGFAYISGGRFKEARATLTPIAQAHTGDDQLALALRDVCHRLKDEKTAEEWFTRALDAIAVDPNRLTQFAYQWQQRHPEWAFRAWKKYAEMAPDGQKGYGLYEAATLAQQAGREGEAVLLYLDTLLAKGENSYATSALSQLVTIAQKEEHLRTMEKWLAQRPDDPTNPSRNAIAALLHYQLEKLKKSPRAKEFLTSAARLDGLNYDAIMQIATALVGENQYDEAIAYAMNGGGRLGEDQRRQVIRNLSNQFQSDQTRGRQEKLLRYLTSGRPDQNTPNDIAQLVSCLTSSGKLDEAEAEVRGMKLTQDSWAVRNAWSALINVHINQHHFEKAMKLGQEFVKLENGSTQYYEAFGAYARACMEAARQSKLDAANRQNFRTTIADASKHYFDRPQGTSPWAGFNHAEFQQLTVIDLNAEMDTPANAAGASEDPVRVSAAAQYFWNTERLANAIKLYTRALTLKRVDARSINPSLYSVYFQAKDFGSALDLLEKLRKQRVYQESQYLQERMRCMYGMNRIDEARISARKLLDLREFWRNGYWSAQSLAYECQKANDWTMAAESWELALRLLRRQRIDPSTIGQFYQNCAQAYAQNGDSKKALDCFLRGMSLVPRTDQAYANLLDAAMKTVLNGATLDSAVADYLKQVSAPGGGEKPQLRLAFAESYKKAGDQRKMLEHLRVAADLLPHDVDLRKKVIDGFRALNDNAAAMAAYWSWAKLDPQNIDVYRGMGELFDALGNRADALLAWSTMAQIRPREADGYRAYAQKLAQVGQPGKAAAAYRQAIKYRPSEFDIAQELSRVYQSLNEAEKISPLWIDGEAACRKAIENVEDDPAPWLNLGRFLETQNRKGDARKLYETIASRKWPRFQNETYTTVRERLGKL